MPNKGKEIANSAYIGTGTDLKESRGYLVDTVNVPVQVLYRVRIGIVSSQMFPQKSRILIPQSHISGSGAIQSQSQSQGQSVNNGFINQYQKQSFNGNSQTQYQSSIMTQNYPTSGSKIQLNTKVEPNHQPQESQTTLKNNYMREQDIEEIYSYIPSTSSSTRTTKIWSTTKEKTTQSSFKPTQQKSRPYPTAMPNIETSRHMEVKTTTVSYEKFPVENSTKNPTNKIVFPDGDHHEIEIDTSYKPDYLNLNKTRKFVPYT